MTRVLFTNPADRPWTDAEIETVVKLWNAGKSAGEIGVELNCTRSRVIGKVTRLRKQGVISRDNASPATSAARSRGQTTRSAPPAAIRTPGTPQEPKMAPPRPKPVKTAPERHRKAEDASELPVRLVASSTPKPPRVLIPVPETIEVLNLGLMDMLRSHCRWPTEKDAGGIMRYCGNHVDGRRSYCSHHAARMYARAG